MSQFLTLSCTFWLIFDGIDTINTIYLVSYPVNPVILLKYIATENTEDSEEDRTIVNRQYSIVNDKDPVILSRILFSLFMSKKKG